MRTALSTCAARRDRSTGPNWLDVGRAKVDVGLGACIVPSTTLVVDFDRRHAADCGQSLVNVAGQPDLVLSRRFRSSLRARICGRLIAQSADELHGITVTIQELKVNAYRVCNKAPVRSGDRCIRLAI